MQRISDWNPRKKLSKCLLVDQTSKKEEEFYVPERYPFCTNLRQNYFFQRPSCHHIFFHSVIELTKTGIHQPTLNSQTIITDFFSRPLFCRQILHQLRITAALINESPSLALVPTAHQTLKSWSFCAPQRDTPKRKILPTYGCLVRGLKEYSADM